MTTQNTSDSSTPPPAGLEERDPDTVGHEVTTSESDLLALESLQVFQAELEQSGYSSVFEVADSGPEVGTPMVQGFARNLELNQTVDFYEQAQDRAASLSRLYAQLCSRSDPAMQAVSRLGVQYDSAWMQRSLGGTGSYDSWFAPASGTRFAHPDSVGSLFSPASYLTDLYRVAKPLHPPTHGLQLNRRRPDLANLALSEANVHEEVSTLALTLEVLEAGVDGDVDELLRTSLYPMNLPYNHASEQILQGMAARKSSPAELWSVFGDYEDQALQLDSTLASWATRMPAAYARDALGMSPDLLKILTEARNTSDSGVAKYFGHSGLVYLSYVSSLEKALKMPTETMLVALGAGPFYAVTDLGKLELKVDPDQVLEVSYAGPLGGGPFRCKFTDMSITVRNGNELWLSFTSVCLEGNTDYVMWLVQTGNTQAHATEQSSTVETSLAPTEDRYWSQSLSMTTDQYQLQPEPFYIQGVNTSTDGIDIPLSAPIRVLVTYIPRIIPPQIYGARYINGWEDGTAAPAKPLYIYMGAALGHPVPAPPNDPATSGLYNRNGRAFERLNRLVRLQRHVKVLSFEQLDWLISQASDDISAHPLTQPLQALAIYLPLRQRYGMTVDSFAACLGVLNTFNASGKTSFYTSLFGADDLIGQLNVDFQRSTVDQASLRARARLCQGLQIDDASLVLLAQNLPGMAGNILPVLGLEQISALYRLVAIPRVFGLRVVEAVHLWELLGAPNAIVSALAQPRPNQTALAVMIRTGYLVDWMRAQQLDAAQVIALTSRRYPVQKTPELQAFIENIYSTLTGREPVPSQLLAAEDVVLRAQLARHIGAEFGLKPNIVDAMLVWVDAVAKDMAPTLDGYGLLRFWEDIERICQGLVTLENAPQVVQYAHLVRQFAQVCIWAQLGEQDLELLMPVAQSRPSALTGASVAPSLTLNFLLLLSRYRQWQRQLVGPVAEARGYLQRAAQDPVLTPQVAAQLLSDLQGWDLTQTLELMGTSAPRHFVALQPLLQKMQLSRRLNLSPTDLLWAAKLTETNAPAQPILTLIAAKVIAAAHG